MNHIHSNLITMVQYLHEQMKKTAGQLEDIFMQTVPVEDNREPKPHTSDTKIHMNQGRTKTNREGERDSIGPKMQDEEASGRHTVCDNLPDCIADDDAPSMNMKSSPHPVRNEIRTRSGRISHKPV